MTFKQQAKYWATSCQGWIGLVDLYGGLVDLDGGIADLDGDMVGQDISTDHKKYLCYPQFSKLLSSSASYSSTIQCLYVESTNVSELSVYTVHNSHFIFILYTT